MKVISGSFTITAVEDGENAVAYEIADIGSYFNYDPNTDEVSLLIHGFLYKVEGEERTAVTGHTIYFNDDADIINDEYGSPLSTTTSSTGSFTTDALTEFNSLDFKEATIITVYANDDNGKRCASMTVRKNIQGKNAIRLDLDNENDSMLYDGNGMLVSGAVTSQARLYDGATEVTSGITWSITGKEGVIDSDVTIVNGLVTVKGITATTAFVQVCAKYNREEYYANLTIKKLVGVDKYELIVTPNAFTYNTSSAITNNGNVQIQVYRTAQNEARKLVTDLGSNRLYYRYNDSVGYTEITADYNTAFDNNGTYLSRQISFTHDSYEFQLRDSSGNPLDTETIPINKSANGADGADGASGISVILDLSNDNDSIIYNELGEKISSDVSTIARLYVNGVATSVLWGITGSENVDVTLPWVGYGEVGDSCTIIITGIASNAMSGYVEIKAEYEGNIYTAKFSVTKLINQSRYELIVTPNVITANTDATNTHTINIEVYETTASGVRQSISSLPNSYSLFYKHNGNGDYKSGSLTYYNGFASYSYDDDCGATYISFYISQDIDSTTYLDSETISVGYVSNGADGADGADGSDGADGNDGNTPIVVYKAAYEKPTNPTSDYVNEGWSENAPNLLENIEISYGGLWIKDGLGLYRSHPDMLNRHSMAIEERFYFNNTNDTVVYLPFLFTASSESSDYGYLLGKPITDDTEDVVIHYEISKLPTRYSNVQPIMVDDEEYSPLSVSGTDSQSGLLKIPKGRSFVILVYSKDGSYSSNNDCVHIQFGNRAIWQCTMIKDGVSGKLSIGDVVKTDRYDSRVSDMKPSEIAENKFLGSRFVEGKRDKWLLQSNAYFTEGFGKANMIQCNTNSNYHEFARYLLYDINGTNILQNGTNYVFSAWARGNDVGLYLTGKFKGTYSHEEYDSTTGEYVTYTGEAVVEDYNHIVSEASAHGETKTVFVFGYSVGGGAYIKRDITFKTRSDMTTGSWALEKPVWIGELNDARTVTLNNCQLQEVTLRCYDQGNSYLTSLFMPKLEANTYPTEFNVNDSDVGGLTGKMVYPAGIWSSEETYTSTETTTPYVTINESNTGTEWGHYWLNKESATGINPIGDNSKTWIKFNKMQAVFADALVADFAKIASAVYYQKYMFSQYGKDKTTGEDRVTYAEYASADKFDDFVPYIKLDFFEGTADFRKINIGGDATFDGVVTAKALYRGFKVVYPEFLSVVIEGTAYDIGQSNSTPDNPTYEDFIFIKDAFNSDQNIWDYAQDASRFPNTHDTYNVTSCGNVFLPNAEGLEGKEVTIINNTNPKAAELKLYTAIIGGEAFYNVFGDGDCEHIDLKNIRRIHLVSGKFMRATTQWIVLDIYNKTTS